ncbi:ranBP2-type zinc finger protein [Canna indica]|uniref:RanBP2-type zinc finger protein n=1 Tax=Canna indica TaxID=4628 RepID=A0AAQ3KZ24_9LILI|nr:ranBP2-type zinc finger protein [Canna indica]
MSQVDNRNSSAGKRARTDGGRREDDWTCPSCGNVNFSFRTTCNMRNCTQSRPADHNGKFAPKSLQAPPPYSSAAGYVGYGAPSSMYLRAPPYGSSIFSGPPLPHYDMPFSGGSAYPYEYGSRLSVGSPYGPLHMSGPPPYSTGSLMGTGAMYGIPPMVDRYGLGLPMEHHGSLGSRAGAYHDEGSQKKNAGEGRENDWTCPNCGNNNFGFRTVCNMRKCNTPRPGSQGSKSDNSKSSKPKMPEGSWKCEKCNNINYPFRTKCNRQNCGAEKPSQTNSQVLSSNEDDQEKNFRRRKRNHWEVWIIVESDKGVNVDGEGGSIVTEEFNNREHKMWMSDRKSPYDGRSLGDS